MKGGAPKHDLTEDGPPFLSVGAKAAARMCGVSERSWWRLDSACKTPTSFMLGGRRLWRVADLERWVAAGFPNRKDFVSEVSRT